MGFSINCCILDLPPAPRPRLNRTENCWPEGLVLDGCEHGGRLVCVGIDCCCMMPPLIIDRGEISDRGGPAAWIVERSSRTPTGPFSECLFIPGIQGPGCGLQSMRWSTKRIGAALRHIERFAVDRGLEVPAWMFDRSCCPDRTHLTEAPFVSAGAREALSAVLDMASKASLVSSNPRFLAHPTSLATRTGESAMPQKTVMRRSVRRQGLQLTHRQRELFEANPPDSVVSAPAWPELPVEARAALTGLNGATDATARHNEPAADREGDRP